MERRDFIKTGCSLCMAAGLGFVFTSLSSCTPVYMATVADNKIKVPVSLFVKTDMNIVRAQHFEYDIALRKESGEKYSALLLRCTHADNHLKSTGTSFICDLHGSTFDETGAVTKGPAGRALKKLTTENSMDQIIIYLT